MVWRAWDTQLEREVAVKEPVRAPGISAAMASELAARFVQEGKTAARLNHPGIVTIYAADVWGGRSAIVMELLKGHTLAELIDARNVPPAAAWSILDQLLGALEYAHGMGVVHRDVKPDNVFVTSEGRVKLTDFGVACLNVIGGPDEAVVAGSPGYMAPEQIRAELPDTRSDLFSVGVIAYELLNGTNPFGATAGLDSTTVMHNTLAGVVAPFPRGSGASEATQAVVLKAIAPDRVDRFQSAGEMRAAFGAPEASGIGLSDIAWPQMMEGLGDHEPGVMFDTTTVGEPRSRSKRSGSSATMALAALAIVGIAFGGVMLSQDGGAFGIVIAAAGLFAALGAVLSSHKGEKSEPSADPFAQLASVSRTVELQVLGPGDNAIITVSLPAVIGRSAEAEVVVADQMVSRDHARLSFEQGALFIEDLGSNNGTYVDGFLIREPTRLESGSEVVVGHTTIRTNDMA